MLPEATLLVSGGEIVWANRIAAGLLAVDQNALRGRPLAELAAPAEAAQALLERFSRAGQPLPGVLPVRRNGEICRLRCDGGVAVPPAEGAPAILYLRLRSPSARDSFAVLNDRITRLNHEIAMRRHAEAQLQAEQQKLRESRELLMIALGASRTGTFRWEPDADRFAEFGANLRQLFGFAPEDSVRTTDDFLAHLHPEDLLQVRHALERCRAGGELEIEHRVVLPEGGMRWLYTRGQRFAAADGKRYLLGACTDISRRKRAELELRESEQQFRTLAESIPQLAWIANADGWIFWYNQRWYAYTGTTPQQMSGWGWQAVHDPKMLPDVLERWKASLRDGKPFDMIFPLRGADGAYRPFLSRAMPVRDSEGRVVRWFGTNTDVSEQQRSQEALRDSRERLHMALAASRTGTFRWDPQTGEFLSFDDNLKALFEMDPEQPIAVVEDWLRNIHPEDVAKVIAAVDASRKGAEFEMEYRVVLRDGSVRWLYDRAQVVEADGRKLLVGACTDITRRKDAEAGLLASQARLKLVLEASHLGSWYLDLRDGVLRCDANTREHWWFAPGEPATLDGFYERLHGDDRDRVRRAMQAAIEEGKPYDIDYRTLEPATRELRWIRASGRTFQDEHGTVTRFDGITMDLTARKQAEETLRRSEKLAAAGRLAATIAHEINNPLEAVTNLLYLAAVTSEVEEIHKYVRLADEELRRVSQIARQTLGFYRETSQPSRFALTQAIDDVLAVHAAKLRGCGIEVERRYRDPGEVTAFRGEICQVITNVVANAIDACARGGRVRITVQRRARGDSPFVVIGIADSGVGIPRQNWEKIFEPFFTTKKDVGTGLGLWVSREILHKHGGRISVRSSTEPGRSGTIFTIVLPAEQPQNAEAASGETAA